MFYSLPFEPRRVEATEKRLSDIYEAAKLGLKGDALALASGMLPSEFNQLCQLDPVAEIAARKGKADGEMEHAQKLREASLAGDAKASLAILQHVHGWTAKQEISMTVENISISDVLTAARARAADVIEVNYGTATGLLSNGRTRVNADDLGSQSRQQSTGIRADGLPVGS